MVQEDAELAQQTFAVGASAGASLHCLMPGSAYVPMRAACLGAHMLQTFAARAIQSFLNCSWLVLTYILLI